MSEFEIIDLTEIDLEGGILIECFPTNSPLALITANAILESYTNRGENETTPGESCFDQIAIGDSNQLPSVTLVYYTKPKFPIRIYANKDIKVALLVSEIPQYPPITREIGKVIFEWTKKQKIQRIVSIDSFQSRTAQMSHVRQPEDIKVYGIGTTEHCRKELQDMDIPLLVHGVIKGLSAVLLNEGWLAKKDVVVLLGEIRQGSPGIRTAAKILSRLEKLIPALKVDTSMLLDQAEEFEQMVVSMQSQASNAIDTREPRGPTYI